MCGPATVPTAPCARSWRHSWPTSRTPAKITYTDIEAGTLPATEVGYTISSELLDGPQKKRAFAVSTPRGPVVVHLGGLDSAEYEEMLPAYELAKRTVRLG